MSCYKASGKVFMRKKTIANQPFRFIGNAQAVLNTELEETSVPDYTSAAGGNACADKIISKVTLDLTMYDFSSENWAKAVAGVATVGSVVAIVGEAIRGFLDEFIPFANINDPAVPPVIKDATDATTYVLNTDYTVEIGGIRVVNGSSLATAIAAGAGTPKSVILHASYTPIARSVIEALTRASDTYEVLLVTQNRADAGKVGRWDIYSVDFGPAAALNLITREFANNVISGEVKPDITQGDGNTESQYFTIQNQT